MPPTSALARLREILPNSDVYTRATELYNLANGRTAPGSGHDIGGNRDALIPICAFLASERLGYGDFTRTNAQRSACLAPREFQQILQKVTAALHDQLAEPRTRTRSRSKPKDAVSDDGGDNEAGLASRTRARRVSSRSSSYLDSSPSSRVSDLSSPTCSPTKRKGKEKATPQLSLKRRSVSTSDAQVQSSPSRPSRSLRSLVQLESDQTSEPMSLSSPVRPLTHSLPQADLTLQLKPKPRPATSVRFGHMGSAAKQSKSIQRLLERSQGKKGSDIGRNAQGDEEDELASPLKRLKLNNGSPAVASHTISSFVDEEDDVFQGAGAYTPASQASMSASEVEDEILTEAEIIVETEEETTSEFGLTVEEAEDASVHLSPKSMQSEAEEDDELNLSPTREGLRNEMVMDDAEDDLDYDISHSAATAPLFPKCRHTRPPFLDRMFYSFPVSRAVLYSY